MSREAPTLRGVNRLFQFAVHPCVDICRKGDPERIVRMQADDARVGSDEQVELIGETYGNVFRFELLQEKRLDHA